VFFSTVNLELTDLLGFNQTGMQQFVTIKEADEHARRFVLRLLKRGGVRLAQSIE
jgi:hypothetical protein